MADDAPVYQLSGSERGGRTDLYSQYPSAACGQSRLARHRSAQSRSQEGVSDISEYRFCGNGNFSGPPLLVRAVKIARPDSPQWGGFSAVRGKLCVAEISSAANLALTQFHLHLGGFLSGFTFSL